MGGGENGEYKMKKIDKFEAEGGGEWRVENEKNR